MAVTGDIPVPLSLVLDDPRLTQSELKCSHCPVWYWPLLESSLPGHRLNVVAWILSLMRFDS